MWNAFGGLGGRAPYTTPGPGRRNVYLRSADMARVREAVRGLAPDARPAPPAAAAAAAAADDADDIRLRFPPCVRRCAAASAGKLRFPKDDDDDDGDDDDEDDDDDDEEDGETPSAGAAVRPVQKAKTGTETSTETGTAAQAEPRGETGGAPPSVPHDRRPEAAAPSPR